eukprot:PITA_35358
MSLDLTLEEKEVMDYVQGKIPEPPSNALVVAKTKYNKAEVKAKKIIRDSIDKHSVAYISELKTSKEIYNKLVGMFKVSNANQILFLKNKFKDIKKGKDEDIQSYFLRITEIKNDLLSIGEVIADRELSLTTLGGLPHEWYVFRTTILNNDRIPRPGSKGGSKGRAALFTIKFGHYARECPNKRDTARDDDCHNNSRGNFNNNNNDQRNGRSNGKGKRNVEHQGNGRPSKKSRNSSGASRHFTRYKEALSNLIEKETNLEIILGDDATYPVKRVGDVTLQLNQGNTIHLQEVLYVPDLKKNLVSISAMEDKGFKVAFIDGKVCVWKRNLKDSFTLGLRVDSLYQVGGSPLGAMSCDTSLQSELWHRRFAHLHYKALPAVRQMVTGIPEFKVEHEGVCPGCAEGKLTRGPFPSSNSKTT